MAEASSSPKIFTSRKPGNTKPSLLLNVNKWSHMLRIIRLITGKDRNCFLKLLSNTWHLSKKIFNWYRGDTIFQYRRINSEFSVRYMYWLRGAVNCGKFSSHFHECSPPTPMRFAVISHLRRRTVDTSGDVSVVGSVWRKTRPKRIESRNWSLFASRALPPYARGSASDSSQAAVHGTERMQRARHGAGNLTKSRRTTRVRWFPSGDDLSSSHGRPRDSVIVGGLRHTRTRTAPTSPRTCRWQRPSFRGRWIQIDDTLDWKPDDQLFLLITRISPTAVRHSGNVAALIHEVFLRWARLYWWDGWPFARISSC